jgi:hypothetical protein
MIYTKSFQELSSNEVLECNGGIAWVPIIALAVAIVGGGGYCE